MVDNSNAAPLDPKEGLFAFDNFRGLRNTVGADAFAPGDLTAALNVDIDDALGIGRRRGFSTVVTASVDRDVWANDGVCLGVGGDALKLINPDYTTTTLRAGLTPGRPLAYEMVGQRVFWSNGVESGVVQNGASRSWGLAVPGWPAAAAVGGDLLAGLYQYAVTYLRSDGQESGARIAGTITLGSTGGVSLSSVPVSADPTVALKAIYATSVGGETLYQVGIIPNAQTTFLIDTIRPGASPLITQFLQPPPPGDVIANYNGNLLVAAADYVYPSEPYSPELFDFRKSVPFGGDVTMLAPMPDGSGMYVGTSGRLIWIQGDSPDAWRYQEIAQYGVIPGTLAYGDSNLLGQGGTVGKVAFFATQRGLCVGKPGGQVLNLTEDRFAYPIQPRGAGVARRHRGIGQYVCTMQGAETAGNVAA